MNRKLFYLATTFVLAGCGSSGGSQGSSVSTVKGALDMPSFPNHPKAVEAVNERGTTIRSTLDVHAAFQLRLPKGHTYRLIVDGSSPASLPVVFKRTSGKVDTSFHVSGGGAIVKLGTLRFFSTGASTVPADDVGDVSCGDEGPDAVDGECENGVDKTTGAACTDPPEAADTADGECENGVDKTTGAACTDPPESGDGENADPGEGTAVADHNAPDDVGGCDGEDPAD